MQGLINQGAQRGVNLAIRIPDMEYELTDSNPDTVANYERFLQARQNIVGNPSAAEPVVGEAVSLPLTAFVRGFDSPSALAHFVGFDNYPGPNGTSSTVNAVLLRPGECQNDNNGVQH